ncbi:MAG: hypothetical protein L0Y58_24180 [Verrucomicrobia subdivision 3 bacterium]|nr:hypothetical protein [Limisphaerales bacterium]
MKAPTLLSCFLITLNLSALAQAPSPPADTPAQEAIREGLRREAARIELRQKLADAQAAQRKGDFDSARRLYDEALDRAKFAGVATVQQEYAQVLTGMTQTRLILAEQAQRRGEFQIAADHAKIILKEDPQNTAALAFQAQNEQMRAQLAGKMPSQETIAKIPDMQQERVSAGTLVQDGKLLFEAGKLDAAEAKLQQAIDLDPANTAAFTYLNLIREQRFRQENAKREDWSKQKVLEVRQAWNPPVNRDLPSSGNAYARTNLVNTGRGRQALYSKLDRIRLDSVSYDGLPLSEVVKSLSEEAKKRDPEKRGINIIVSANVDPPSAPPATIDPATGLPVATAAVAAEPIDLAVTTIRIVPPLTDVTLGQALDAVVKVADRPIKYSVEEYAIVFSPKSTETPALHTRWFKVDPNTFVQGLAGVVGIQFGAGASEGGGGGGGGGRGGGGRGGGGGGGQGGQQDQISGAEVVGVRLARIQTGIGGQAAGGAVAAGVPPPGQTSIGQPGIRHLTFETTTRELIDIVRQFFQTAGVDLTAPKAVFFNDRLGMLMVRATLQDLDVIEQAVQVLNMSPPQISIEAKFAEVTQTDSKALGFDWFLGNTLLFDNRAGFQGGTAPTFSGQPSTANPVGAFPTPLTPIPPQATDGLLTSGLRQQVGIGESQRLIPEIGTLTGILTDPQFRLIIRALENRTGVDLLSAPKVTTISGRQTQIKVVDVRTVALDTDIEQTGGGTGN